MADEDPLLIPVPGEESMDAQSTSLLREQLFGSLNAAAARRVDGADAYAENLRYDYLEGKANLSMTESMGPRYLQGPHPQFGSPGNATGQ